MIQTFVLKGRKYDRWKKKEKKKEKEKKGGKEYTRFKNS